MKDALRVFSQSGKPDTRSPNVKAFKFVLLQLFSFISCSESQIFFDFLWFDYIELSMNRTIGNWCTCFILLLPSLPLSLLHSLLHYLYWVTLVSWHNVSCVLDILKFKHLKFVSYASNISENAMSPSELNIETHLAAINRHSSHLATPVQRHHCLQNCNFHHYRHHNCQSSS